MPDTFVERRDHTLVVTMNRPHRYNALTPQMIIRMYDAMVDACADDQIRSIVLTGADGNFSSGADLRAMAGDADETDREIDAKERFTADPGLMFKAMLRDYRPTKPIIAAVEGVAIAGGTEILLATDIRVAGTSARFGVSEVRWGLYPMAGSAVRLPRQIHPAHAAEMLLTGRHITAEEAARVGLVSRVVPDGEALPTALEIADAINRNGPLAVEAILRTLHETDGMTEREALDHEISYGHTVIDTMDAQEGARAFTEKRAPHYRRM
jgi:enoyl-CoA hydratase